MAEPGPRPTHPEIIDRPKLKSPLRHATEGSLTVALWALWVYWILPVVTIFLWLAGVRFLYYKIFLGRGLLQLLSILRDGGLAILAIFVLNLVWVNYNYYLIFKRLGERRKQVGQCSDKMVAEFFKMDTQTLEKAKRRRSINLALTEEGFIVTDELN